MAESFVSCIAENLVGKIASLVQDEVALAWGLETDLKLRELLITANAVLLDAEEKQAQNHELRLWLGMLKNFCYDAEDVLDELDYEGLRKIVLKQYGNTKIKVCRFFSSSNALVFRRKMGHKVKKLKERLDEIANHKSKFHLEELVDFRQADHRSREMTDSLLRKWNIIGRDGDKEKILELLLHQKQTLSVIPIVGLGGMGKTTLAKMLYNDENVDDHFDLKIWVCVSEIFEKKQIMVSMIKSLTHKDHSVLDPDQLQQMIQEHLNSKRFLLVLDDIWSDDRGKWIEFRELLEGGAPGSKVIVTTRDVSVADTVRTDPLYNLKGLSHEQCLSLFKKLAFREGEEESHMHLIEIGDDIVKKCGGVPLAVKTMGTLLYSKSDESYWKFIRDRETWKLEQKKNDILPALKLSYDQLASYLKPCFAICSIFPKDYMFRSDKLTRLWMVNGLLQSSNGQRGIEDIGIQYIKELYSRSFLQDFEEHHSFMYFKMHDLVHDLALSISQNECLVVNARIENVPEGIRYMAFHGKDSLDQEFPSFQRKENRLRTILAPLEVPGFFNVSFIYTWISTSKYLRVLDFSGSSVEVLPSSIGGLTHLRYLDLGNNCRIKRLPNSFWTLHNMLYLNLSGCLKLKELPRDIRNLIKLRDLRIRTKQKRLPDDGIGCLRSLQFLSIQGCSKLEYLFKDIEHLTSLFSLKVKSCDKLITLPHNLMYLNTLKYLIINKCSQFNWMEEDIHDISLSLGYLSLERLPQVVTLPQWLHKSSKTLQLLHVDGCDNFSSFPEWLQDFTSLEELSIFHCPKLVSLPEGMHRLTSLKELRIYGCPVLSDRYASLRGEDRHKIAHVPNIYITRPYLAAKKRASSPVQQAHSGNVGNASEKTAKCVVFNPTKSRHRPLS